MVFTEINGVCVVCDLKNHAARCELCAPAVAHARSKDYQQQDSSTAAMKVVQSSMSEQPKKNISSGEDAFGRYGETYANTVEA